MDFDVLAEGLQFPEGPIAMPDGSVILVEIRRGTLSRVWNGKVEVVCDLGGGPNGAALGPDGAVYVANNGGGGMAGGPRPAVKGGIDRVDLATGKSERLYDTVAGNPLSAPNDIVFDAEGGFWFTDFGRTTGRTRHLSGVYYAKPDGSEVSEISFGGTGYNGIGLSPDEKTVYSAESYTGRLIAFDLAAGPGQVVNGGRLPAAARGGPGGRSPTAFACAGRRRHLHRLDRRRDHHRRCPRPAPAVRTHCPTGPPPTSASAAKTCATRSSPSPRPAG